MIITHLEKLEKAKVKVYIEGEYAFLLYQKDIQHFKLAEGEEITQELYAEILEDTVYRRAKQKTMSILKFMDRTEAELRKKLADADLTKDVIDRAVAYVEGFGYINDERFTSAYTRTRKNTKSKLIIKTELIQKGVDKDIIERVFLEEYENQEQEDAELVALRKAIAKKTKTPENMDFGEKQKLIASLYRKGFEISKIKQILS